MKLTTFKKKTEKKKKGRKGVRLQFFQCFGNSL